MWLPALLACVEALARRWRWRSWLALVAVTTLQWLAGFPQFAVYSLHLVLPFAALRSLTHQGVGRAGFVRLAGIGAALALGLGAAGAQLLPSLELVLHSARSFALGADEIHYLGDASSAAAALRNAVDPSPKLLAFDYAGGGNYLGIATLLLLGVGVLNGPPGLVALLVAVGALALLLSDGFNGPGAALYRLYAELPGVGAFRTPERLRILTLLCAIVVACIGLDRLGRGLAIASRRRAWVTAPLTTLAAIAIVRWSGAELRTGVAFALVVAACVERNAGARQLAQALLVGCAVRNGDFDFHAGVLLDRDPGGLPDAYLPLRAARILAHAPERVEVAVDAPADGLLVLTDTWYPGWRATRDGRELDILRANGLFRAVRVPAGESRVVFEYRPDSFRWGLALSAASLALAAAVPWVARRRHRGFESVEHRTA